MRTALVAGVACLALAGCTMGAQPAVTAEPRAGLSDPSDPQRMKTLLVRQDPAFDRIDTETIGRAGVLICGSIDDGMRPSEIGQTAMNSGFTMDQAVALVAAAIVVFCPWHEGSIR
jgi:hypothetical protein